MVPSPTCTFPPCEQYGMEEKIEEEEQQSLQQIEEKIRENDDVVGLFMVSSDFLFGYFLD